MESNSESGQHGPDTTPTAVIISKAWYTPLLRFVPQHIPIAYKLAFVLTLLITASMVILGLIIVSNQSHLLRQQIDDFGRAMVDQLAESSKELVLSDDILSLMVVVNNLSKSDNILGAVVYSHKGEIIAHTGRLPVHDIMKLYNIATALDDTNYSFEWIDYDQTGKPLDVISFITPIRYQKTIAGHALVTYDKSSLSQALHDTLNAILGATLFMILVGIVTAYYVGKRITKPIANLMDASRAINNGDYNFRINQRRNDEIGYLINAFNSMANGLLEKNQVENAFSRFVSTKVAKQIMENLDHVQLGGKRMNATALFADIVGFTSLSERLPAEEIATLLNEYFSYIDTASKLYRGMIDKYMGDCAMVVFGAPEVDTDHKFNGIACAILIQRLVARLNVERAKAGKHTVDFRIGVNSGEMLAGNLGSQERMQYTVVGESVNLASRLHSVADKGQIIITEFLAHDPDLDQRIITERNQSIRLRGIADPVTTYLITGIKPGHSDLINSHVADILRSRKVA